ncbi:hypothetical protein LCGC14_3165100, partial [marine sediment metagenome]
GVTGHATFGDTVTIDGILGVTGWAFFGSTVTMHAALGVTGTATIDGQGKFTGALAVDGAFGVTSTALFGATLTANAALGVTGVATFGSTITAMGQSFEVSSLGDISTSRRIYCNNGALTTVSGVSIGSKWGSGSTVTIVAGSQDARGGIIVTAATSPSADPIVQVNFEDTVWNNVPFMTVSRGDDVAPAEADWLVTTRGTAAFIVKFKGTPVDGSLYILYWILVG